MTVLGTLLETGLPSFDTVCVNASLNFRSRWSHCNNSMVIMLRHCVHVRLIVLLTVYHAFFKHFRAWFYIRISVVNIFCLSSLLFMGHMPELKID